MEHPLKCCNLTCRQREEVVRVSSYLSPYSHKTSLNWDIYTATAAHTFLTHLPPKLIFNSNVSSLKDERVRVKMTCDIAYGIILYHKL